MIPEPVRFIRSDASAVAPSTAPRAAIIIASVTMNGGRRTFAIRTPFVSPSAVAAPTPATSEAIIPLADTFAATTPATATREPTDRSIPPVRITTVIPSATSPSMLFCRSTFSRFSGVAKEPYRTTPRTQTAISATSAPWRCSTAAVRVENARAPAARTRPGRPFPGGMPAVEGRLTPRLGRWKYTATRMMAAFSASDHAYGTSSMFRLVAITCMISAPITVPTMVARPPVSAVPPTTVAAMASSSMFIPIFAASLAPSREASINPARPASPALPA